MPDSNYTIPSIINPRYNGSKITSADYNYTQLSSINPRYKGSRLESLDYNNFTPSGTIGVVQSLPIQRYNQRLSTSTLKYSSSVAESFINGTASFNQNDINPNGSASWVGDSSYGKTAVIDKHPMYIAHFQDSFEQFNYWDSYEYNVDSVIFIPTESIANLPYEPNSIGIDGNNFNKKLMSSVFEPSRKMGVSYDQQQFKALNLNTLIPKIGVGSNIDIGGGSIKYLTINGNAQDRLSNAPSWSYSYKSSITSSVQTSTGLSQVFDPAVCQLAVRENTIGGGS